MLGDLTVKIGADIKELQAGLNKASSRLKSFGGSISSTGRTLTASLSLPIAAIGGLALKTAADFERMQIQLNGLTGSAEEGRRAFERLNEFSKRTPFEPAELVKANNTLMGFGMNVEEAYHSLQELGDVASGSGANLQDLAVVFGQSAAEGKLFTRDIRQFINQGVPATKLLAESLGVATGEVFKLAEQGQISFSDLQEAIRKATSEGGIYEDATENQANTISGVFSTLTGNVKDALKEIGKSIFETFNLKDNIKLLTSYIEQITDKWKELSKETKKRILVIAGLIGAGGPVLIAIGALITAFGSLAAAVQVAFSPVTLTILAVVGLLSLVGIATKNVIDNFDAMADDIGNAMTLAQIRVLRGVMEIGNALIQLAASTAPMGSGVSAMIGLMADKFVGSLDAMKSKITELDGELTNPKGYISFGQSAKNLGGLLKEQLGGAFDFVLSFLPNFKTSLDQAANGQDKLAESTGNASQQLADQIAWFKALDNVANMTFDNSISKWESFKDKFKTIGGDLKQFLAGELSSAVLSFGDALGRSLAGADNQWMTTFEKITIVVLDFAKSLAQLAAGIGAVMMFIPGMQGAGIGLLAAATALQAIASGFTASINKKASRREGNQTSVNDALIKANGDIVKFHPDDNILAMKDFGNLIPNGVIGGGMQKVHVTVEGRLDGNDIYVSGQRGGINWNR